MPDPIWRGTFRYYDDITGLGWTVSNWFQAAPPGPTVFALDVWNTKYLACCGDNVKLLDFRISALTAWGDMKVYQPGDFATQTGSGLSQSTEIGSYAQFRGEGGYILESSNAWKLHGIWEGLVDGSALLVTNADIVALKAQCLLYFKLYRPVVTLPSTIPIVTTPTVFPTGTLSGMYFRRLGRPFSTPGQSARYTRTVVGP